ncbi:hypothetical protein [Romboutsia sp. MSSM.1001216sp_RTP31141st1_G3_RTP31141_220114]|uniref:hypothetical protein n=1 Tax=unclassified Romboutsia TaxID=2626894 RepID=UPI0031B5D6F5
MKNKTSMILASLIPILILNLLMFKNVSLTVTMFTAITLVIVSGKLLSNVILEIKNN